MNENDIWEQRTWELYKLKINFYNNNEKALYEARESVEYYKTEMGFIEPKKDEPKKKRASKKESFDVREDLSYVSEEFLSLWLEWLDYKDEIKKQYKTQQGAQTQYTSWINFAHNNVVLANALVRRSIENSWQGFFALTDAQRDFYLSNKSPYAAINKDNKEKTEQLNHKLTIDGVDYQ